jgi:hypothetical protein
LRCSCRGRVAIKLLLVLSLTAGAPGCAFALPVAASQPCSHIALGNELNLPVAAAAGMRGPLDARRAQPHAREHATDAAGLQTLGSPNVSPSEPLPSRETAQRDTVRREGRVWEQEAQFAVR